MNIVCSKEIENSFRNASNRIRHNNIFNLCDRFFHAHLGKHASMFSSSDMTNQAANCSLRVGHDGTAGEDNGCNAFKLLYLDKQLPKYVAFKADNGMYLSAQLNENYNYLAFSSDDIGDPTVMNTMFSNEEDGTIRIKSNRFGRFWRRSPSYPYWIWADSTDTAYGDNRDTVFEVIKVGDYFALRNMGNNLFCKRYTDLGMTNCLSAKIETIQIFAKLRLEETVLSREIKVKDIDFHLSRARIYDRRVLVMDSASASNGGSKDNIIKLTLKYTETEKSTWDATASWKLGVTTKIKAGIPMLVDGAVEVSNEFTGSYNWGSTIEKTTSQEVEYQVTVPPRTKVTVRLIASQGSCDVPFSYEQRDILVDGQDLTQNLEDGIYTGINCYDFRYEVEEEKM